MDLSFWLPLILGSSVIAAVIAFFGGRKLMKAQTEGQKIQNAINKSELSKDIGEYIATSVAQAAELAAEKLNNRILEGQIERLETKWETIVENNGYIRKSEEICNERLNAAEAELRRHSEQFGKFAIVHDRAAQQAAELKKLHEAGIWSGDASLLESI